MRDIITAAGGAKRLAAFCDVHRTTVLHWRRVPLHHVAQASRATGFAPADLRPDLAAAMGESP